MFSSTYQHYEFVTYGSTLTVNGACSGGTIKKFLADLRFRLDVGCDKGKLRHSCIDLSALQLVFPQKTYPICVDFLAKYITTNVGIADVTWPQFGKVGGVDYELSTISDEDSLKSSGMNLSIAVRQLQEALAVNGEIAAIAQELRFFYEHKITDYSVGCKKLRELATRINCCLANQHLSYDKRGHLDDLCRSVRDQYVRYPSLILAAVQDFDHKLVGYDALVTNVKSALEKHPYNSSMAVQILQECSGGNASSGNSVVGSPRRGSAISALFKSSPLGRRLSHVKLSDMVGLLLQNMFWTIDSLSQVEQIRHSSSLPNTVVSKVGSSDLIRVSI